MLFQTGQIPWNKGLIGYHAEERHYRYGKKLSDEVKKKISENRKGKTMGVEHPKWKGDNAGYRALHIRLGKASACVVCTSLGGKRGCHWANLSGNYADTNDFFSLCPSCHGKWDSGKLAINLLEWKMKGGYSN